MKTTVIFHSADFDGLFCREIARKFLPDAELIGWDFGDASIPFPPNADRVYVMDLPIDRVFGMDATDLHDQFLFADFKSKMIWIDHHKSSIESHPTDIPGYRIDGVSACRLAWQWFCNSRTNYGKIPAEKFGQQMDYISMLTKESFVDRQVDEPMAVRLAGEYDIWDKRDPDAELFQHGLRSEDVDFQALLEWPAEHSGRLVVRLLNQGRALQYARTNEYRDVITQQGFDCEFDGLKFLACNSHELDIRSQLFVAGIKPHHDGLLGFTFNGKDWRVSIYHAPGKEELDMSVIAKARGGGGHRGAAGFILNSADIDDIISQA